MSAAWSGLLANLAIIAVLISAWTHSQAWTDRWPRSAYLALLGLMASVGAVGVMNLPIEIRPGVIVDLRTTLIALAGLIGGPVVGIGTGIVAAAYRLYLGGAGWPAGLIGIAVATAIGIVGHLVLHGRSPGPRDILIFAAVTALGGLIGFFFLPEAIWLSALTQIGAPTVALIFVSTLIGGLAIVQELSRRETEKSNQTYRAIIDALPDSLNAKDLSGHFLAANPQTAKLMMAESAEALIGKTDFDFYPPETAAAFRADEEKVLAGGKPVTIEQRLVHRDGSLAWLSTMKVPLRDASGSIIGLITHNRDITDRKSLEDQYAESQQRLADAMANMADGLVMFSADERLLLCNDQYRALFPKTAALRVPGARFRDILRASIEAGEQVGIAPEEIDSRIEQIRASLWVPGEQEIETGDGRWLYARVRPADDGTSLTVISDVTETKRAEKALSDLNTRLEKLARTDGLTGLVNRRAFDEGLALEFKRSRRNTTPLSLLMIDVDRFKAFNDTYGHPAGDACLQSLGRCLETLLKRPADVAARYGGEELAAILPDTGLDGAFRVAEEFRNAVRDLKIPHIGSEAGIVTVSIGVSTARRGATTDSTEQLLRRADEALYGAKAAGRDRVHGGPPQAARAVNG